jgi:hypothetical protein
MCRTSGSSKPGENPEQSSKTKTITGGTMSAATGAAITAAGAPGVKSLKTEPVTPYRTAGRPADGKKTAARPGMAKPAPPPTAAAAAAGMVHQQDLTRRVSTRSKKPGGAQVFYMVSLTYGTVKCPYFGHLFDFVTFLRCQRIFCGHYLHTKHV